MFIQVGLENIEGPKRKEIKVAGECISPAISEKNIREILEGRTKT